MRDRALDVILIVLFGLSGIAILALAGLRPMALADKLLAAFIGGGGLSFAALKLRHLAFPRRGKEKGVLVEAGMEARH